MTNINQKQLYEYLNIFGKSKMQGLLKDYLAQSNKSWDTLHSVSDKEKSRIFHCWRSSSLVFGMEDFSQICTKIEDNLINNRKNKVGQLISESKECYQKSILKVIEILQDQKNEY
jgi:HPt (histidine-containing phosphotransfer) domain-containing protein